jgi:hypothetical protein
MELGHSNNSILKVVKNLSLTQRKKLTANWVFHNNLETNLLTLPKNLASRTSPENLEVYNWL